MSITSTIVGIQPTKKDMMEPSRLSIYGGRVTQQLSLSLAHEGCYLDEPDVCCCYTYHRVDEQGKWKHHTTSDSQRDTNLIQ